MLLTGTMEGSLGWYPQLRQAWAHGVGDEIAFSLPSYTNTHLYPGGKDDPEIQRLKEMSSDDFYMERIEGIPMPPRGLYSPNFGPISTSRKLITSLKSPYTSGWTPVMPAPTPSWPPRR